MPATPATGVGKWRYAPAAIVAAIILAASAATALAQTTERVSVATGGVEAIGGTSYNPAISADGRFVAFESIATNLVSGDLNASWDIFVHDRQAGTTERVSVTTGGTEASDGSYLSAISADGRFVAFESDATDLVSGDTNSVRDVFVHDRQTGTTERVSVATGGVEATGGNSTFAAISADGRFVAFDSDATDLVSGDTNGKSDVFVHDLQTGTTERVSVATGGAEATGDSTAPAISADGRFVAFESDANDLVSGDSNGARDIFVHDRQTGTTELVSVATGGVQAVAHSFEAAISADGRFVTFYSISPNLVSGDGNGKEDAFVRDRQTGTTERVSVATGGTEGDDNSYNSAISADGRFVTFYSYATNLVGGDNNGKADVFVHDRQTGTTERVSVTTGGTEATGDSALPAINADGRFVAFASDATDLVGGDTNTANDTFVRDRGTTGATTGAPGAERDRRRHRRLHRQLDRSGRKRRRLPHRRGDDLLLRERRRGSRRAARRLCTGISEQADPVRPQPVRARHGQPRGNRRAAGHPGLFLPRPGLGPRRRQRLLGHGPDEPAPALRPRRPRPPAAAAPSIRSSSPDSASLPLWGCWARPGGAGPDRRSRPPTRWARARASITDAGLHRLRNCVFIPPRLRRIGGISVADENSEMRGQMAPRADGDCRRNHPGRVGRNRPGSDDGTGERRDRRHRSGRHQRQRGDQRGRALRGVPVPRQQPRRQRHERQIRHLRP